jgi:transcriptional regulator with AAA-type ATPase domain
VTHVGCLKEGLPEEVDAPALDIRLSSGVVQARDALIPEHLCRQRHNVLLLRLSRLELRLDAILPLIFHNLPDSCLAQSFPLWPEAALTHVLKRLVNEDSPTQPT